MVIEMQTTYERIKYLRKEILHETQERFAKTIKISRSNLASIEIGRITATERVISDICEKFNVNENWLRNGTGEILLNLNRQQKLANMTAMLFNEEEDSFKNRLFAALSELEEDEWEVLEKIAEKTVHKKD